MTPENKASYLWYGVGPLILLVTSVLPAIGAERTDSATQAGSRWKLAQFQISQISSFQTAGSSFSGEVNWTPSYSLSETVGVRGDLGLSLLKGLSGVFPEGEYQILLSFANIRPIHIELGGGLQTWFGYGTYGLLSGDVAWIFQAKVFSVIDRAFIGYSNVLIPGNNTNVLHLGLGFSF